MKALLEIVDQLLYMLEANGEHDVIAPEHQREAVVTLEAMAREAVAMAQAIREELDARQADVSDAARREELLQRGLEAIAHGKFAHAEDVLAAALEEFPDHHEYYNHLGLIAWERDDMTRAQGYYARAASLCLEQMGALDLGWAHATARSYLRALEGQALCLYRMGQLEHARTLFETLANTCVPDYQGCHYLAGEISHLQGELEDAVICYRRSPVEPSVLYNLALAYFQQHDLSRSAATFIRAFMSNPHVCEALLGRPVTGDGEMLMDGYLSSPSYAREFVEACAPLWTDQVDARAFMARCFEDPMVQRQLRDELRPASFSSYLAAHPNSASEQLAHVHGLALQVLERIMY